MDNDNLGNQVPTPPPAPEQPADGQGEQEKTAIIDKFMQNNPFVKQGPEAYQATRSQSVVMSSREEADAKMAQIQAQNEMYARQQKVAEGVTKASRLGVHVLVAIIFLILAGAAVWVIIVIANASTGPIARKTEDGDDPGGVEIEYGNVGDYKCKNSKCGKILDLDEKQMIIVDGARYYIYNTETNESTLTSISEQDYHAITSFTWGGKVYAILDPESSQSALYCITENRQVTEFTYDEFFYDKTDDIYKGMEWVDSGYIVAKSAGSYRIIGLTNGTEYARGAKGVFAHEPFFFSYESDGTTRVYSSTGTQIYVSKAGNTIFTNGDKFVEIDANNNYRLYGSDGKNTNDPEITRYLSKIQRSTIISSLDSDSNWYHIPVKE